MQGLWKKKIDIKVQPEARFTASDQCFGEEVEFTNNSTNANDYQWDFDDNSQSTLASPTRNYVQPGFYEVSLTASNDGCIDETSTFVQVFPNPVASFEVENQCVLGEVVLSNNSQISSGALTYEWDFEEGSLLTAEEPSFAYSASGDYTVNLEVTSVLGGCVDVVEQPLVIFPVTDAGTLSGAKTFVRRKQPLALWSLRELRAM